MPHHGRNIGSTNRASTKSPIGKPGTPGKTPEDPYVEETARTQANRPVNAGTGKHRGDRRDTSRTYTNNQKHAARGSNPRKDVTTRAR